jgi:hypothetical protein
MALVTPTERAFLKMKAHLLRRNTDAAAAVGEKYHGLPNSLKLESGHKVELTIEGPSDKLFPVLTVELHHDRPRLPSTNTLSLELAKEILGHKAVVYEAQFGTSHKFTVDSEVFGGKADPVPGA